jgi:hypothetical protein
MDTGFAHQPQGAALLTFMRDPNFRGRCRDRAHTLDSAAGFPPVDDVDEIRQTGLLLAPLPRAWGGCGWGTEPEGAPGLFEALRLIGRASLPLGRLYEGHVNAVRLAVRHGTELQRELIRSAVLEGRLFGVWNTESPDLGLRMDEGRLVGGKISARASALWSGRWSRRGPRWAGHSRCGWFRWSSFTPRGDLSDWNPSGMRSSATGRIDLGGISLGDCLKLGGPDDYLAQPDFSGGAWRFLAVQLGGIEEVVQALRQHLLRTGRARIRIRPRASGRHSPPPRPRGCGPARRASWSSSARPTWITSCPMSIWRAAPWSGRRWT